MPNPDAILSITDHRPWPLPKIPWFMFQQWSDLLFAHWSFAPEVIRPLVPDAFELDLFDGKAWIAVTPFRMTDIHLRNLPPLPGAGSFLEMNLRTYIRRSSRTAEAHLHAAPGHGSKDADTKPGIFFFSLDASNLPAVLGARIGFGLPYFWSDMHAELLTEDEWHYTSERKQGGPASVDVTYRPTGPAIERKSDLERFLTERYALYEVRAGAVMRTDIHHVEWPLQPASATFRRNTLGKPHGIPLTLTPELLHFSKQLDVLAYPPVPVFGKP